MKNKFKVGQTYQERGGMWNVAWVVTQRTERVASNGTRIVTLHFACPDKANAYRQRVGATHKARVRLTGTREACSGSFCGTINA